MAPRLTVYFAVCLCVCVSLCLCACVSLSAGLRTVLTDRRVAKAQSWTLTSMYGLNIARFLDEEKPPVEAMPVMPYVVPKFVKVRGQRFYDDYSDDFSDDYGYGVDSDDDIECWNCGEYGHMARDCHRGGYRGPQCWSCGGYGHMRYECHRRYW